MAIRMRSNKPPMTDETKRLRKKIAELRGEVEKLERRKQQLRMPPGEVAYFPGMGKEFYRTRVWRDLRYKVLKENAAKHKDGKARCVQCGVTAGERPLEVDHCRPRSLFPHLELVKENLQVLCHDCNQGKGASI